MKLVRWIRAFLVFLHNQTQNFWDLKTKLRRFTSGAALLCLLPFVLSLWFNAATSRDTPRPVADSISSNLVLTKLRFWKHLVAFRELVIRKFLIVVPNRPRIVRRNPMVFAARVNLQFDAICGSGMFWLLKVWPFFFSFLLSGLCADVSDSYTKSWHVQSFPHGHRLSTIINEDHWNINAVVQLSSNCHRPKKCQWWGEGFLLASPILASSLAGMCWDKRGMVKLYQKMGCWPFHICFKWTTFLNATQEAISASWKCPHSCRAATRNGDVGNGGAWPLPTILDKEWPPKLGFRTCSNHQTSIKKPSTKASKSHQTSINKAINKAINQHRQIINKQPLKKHQQKPLTNKQLNKPIQKPPKKTKAEGVHLPGHSCGLLGCDSHLLHLRLLGWGFALRSGHAGGRLEPTFVNASAI